LRQLWEDRGRPRMPRRPPDVHDALVDARDQLRRYRLLGRLGQSESADDNPAG
ncbi:MAG: hypothetical protein ACRDT5_03320, partial [Mycobacterium sp.]